MFKVDQAAGLAPTKDEQAPIPGTNRRPADVLVRMWGYRGKDMAFDIVVTSPMPTAVVGRAAKENGWAVR